MFQSTLFKVLSSQKRRKSHDQSYRSIQRRWFEAGENPEEVWQKAADEMSEEIKPTNNIPAYTFLSFQP